MWSLRTLLLVCATPVMMLPRTTVAQQVAGSCRRETPVNVIVPDGRLLRGLNADQFMVQAKRTDARISAISDDSGPRRILFLLETGPDVPAAVRVAASRVVADVLSQARAEDSFALLTAGGPRLELPFSQDRARFSEVLRSLEQEPANKPSRGEGVLDALLRGASWFPEGKSSDGILLFTTGLEKDHRTSFAAVQKQLADRRIRLFSFLFAPIQAGDWVGLVRFSATGIDSHWGFVPNRQTIGDLSWGSGGYLMQPGGAPQRGYKLTDDNLELLKTAASRMYSAIIEYYRVTLELNVAPREIKFDVVKSVRRKVPGVQILYPRQYPPCPASP